MHKRGEAAVVTVTGELDLAVADKLRAAIEQVEEPTLVIDLSACGFIDSTGIAVILRSHGRFAEEGRRLVVASPQRQVLRVLELTGLTADGMLVEKPGDALD